MCCHVNVSVCFVCCVFVNCLVKQFAMYLGVVAIFCLMLWMCLVCVLVLCWIDHVWSSKECVCCACDPNERLSAPSIMFCWYFCMSEVISSFRSLRAGSQVFALLMLFL